MIEPAISVLLMMLIFAGMLTPGGRLHAFLRNGGRYTEMAGYAFGSCTVGFGDGVDVLLDVRVHGLPFLKIRKQGLYSRRYVALPD